jgi:hypothetical protein
MALSSFFDDNLQLHLTAFVSAEVKESAGTMFLLLRPLAVI